MGLDGKISHKKRVIIEENTYLNVQSISRPVQDAVPVARSQVFAGLVLDGQHPTVGHRVRDDLKVFIVRKELQLVFVLVEGANPDKHPVQVDGAGDVQASEDALEDIRRAAQVLWVTPILERRQFVPARIADDGLVRRVLTGRRAGLAGRCGG